MPHIMLIALICFIAPVLSHADTRYVHARQANIHAQPTIKSAVVTTLPKNSTVEVIEKQARWFKVSSGEFHGWISKLFVNKTPPLERVSIIEASSHRLNEHARRRASANASSAATRGLRNDERARSSDNDLINFSAVERMEQMSVSESQVQRFMEKTLAD